MSWKRLLAWVMVLVMSLVLAGCALGPAATEEPDLPRSAADALRLAVEGGLPLDGVHIRYEIGSESWQGRTVLDVAGSGDVRVTFDHAGQHDEWSSSLSRTEFLALVKLLVEHKVWEIRGERETGVPDEAYPVITVEVKDLEPLSVGMWHNEALEHARFGALMSELAGLALEVSGGVAR
jgi:hypothetical protein